MSLPPEEELPPTPTPTPPPITQVQARTGDGMILAMGFFPAGSSDPATIAIVDIYDETEAAKLHQPGPKHIDFETGVITVTAPPPPPVRYVSSGRADQQVRTTDNTPTEVFRFPTEVKHVYRANFHLVAIDANNGNTKDVEARMSFKRGTGPAPAQIGSTVVLYSNQDSGANTWAIAASVQGIDLVFSVSGATGRTIDWHLLGEIIAYAPEGY